MSVTIQNPQPVYQYAGDRPNDLSVSFPNSNQNGSNLMFKLKRNGKEKKKRVKKTHHVTYLWNTTTVSGLHKTRLAPYMPLKAIWIIIYAVFAYLAIANIRSSVIRYFDYPVKTLTSIGYDTLPYPSISLCNLNPIKYEKLNMSTCRLMKLNGIEEEYLPPFCKGQTKLAKLFPYSPDKAIFCATNDEECHKMVDDVLENSDTIEYEKTRNIVHSEIIKVQRALNKLGHEMNTFLRSCFLYGSKCERRQTSGFLSAEFGNCVTINPKEKMKIASASGRDTGYKIELYLEKDEYLQQFARTKGYKVVIHEKNTMPMMSNEGIILSGGEEANVALRVSYNSMLGRKYGKVCYDGKDFEFVYRHKYTQEACRVMCLGNITKRYCDCYPIHANDAYKQHNHHNICPSEKVTCEKVVVELMLRNKSLLHSCDYGGCPHACKTIDYAPRVVTRGWPSMYYTSVLWKKHKLCDGKLKDSPQCNVNESNYKTLRESWARLNVYFDTLNYRNTTEALEHDFVAFLAEIGGTTSLFIGISCITLFEILEVIFLLLMKSGQDIMEAKNDHEKSKKQKNKGKFQNTNHYGPQFNTVPLNTTQINTVPISTIPVNTTQYGYTQPV